ncbi:MAG: ferric reductase-like transmembrane domain-containing protein [Hyphomicrobiaceae bacterium]
MNVVALATLYLAVALAPLALAWAGGRPPRPFWDEVASGAGLLAFSILLVEFVLSGRFRAVSRRMGMDVTMRVHQLLARTALVLALVHPLLYQSPFDRERPWDPTRQLTLTSDVTSLATGMMAWVLLGAFVLLSIGRDRIDYRYETWRMAHGLGALLIAALVLHHALTAGRYSADPLLANLWVAMFAIAVLSLAYVYVVRPLIQLGKPWRVKSVQRVALGTWSVMIEPDNHRGLDYAAGQFVWLNIGNSAFSLKENPFSIASAPGSGAELEFIIKELGDFTRTIGSIEPGTRAYIDGAHGNLVASSRAANGIGLIAGGVGVAPLLGILRQLHLDGEQRPTLLVYGNRVADQIVAADELAGYAAVHGTEVVHVLSEPPSDWTGEVGFIDRALIDRLFRPEMRDWLFIVCGPAPMMAGVEDALIARGVVARRILSERFAYD